MSDTERYFGDDWEPVLWTGVMIQFMAQTGWMVWGIAEGIANLKPNTWAIGNSVTESAFWAMRAGNETIFIVMFIMFGIAFIKEPKYQMYFYKSVIWLTFISWLNTFWINLACIIGGAMSGGSWTNLVSPLIYDAFMAIWQSIVYFSYYPGLVKFYRWDEEKPWWKKEEAEDTNWLEIDSNDF